MDFKERLQQPVQYLKGVGPQRAQLLYRLELYRAFDLLFNFPRDYQDFSDRRKVDQLEEKNFKASSGQSINGKHEPPGAGRLRPLTLKSMTPMVEKLERVLIGNRIYDLRTKVGMTRSVLARKVGLKAADIHRLEEADYEGHSLPTLRKIAAVFGMRLEIGFVPLEK